MFLKCQCLATCLPPFHCIMNRWAVSDLIIWEHGEPTDKTEQKRPHRSFFLERVRELLSDDEGDAQPEAPSPRPSFLERVLSTELSGATDCRPSGATDCRPSFLERVRELLSDDEGDAQPEAPPPPVPSPSSPPCADSSLKVPCTPAPSSSSLLSVDSSLKAPRPPTPSFSSLPAALDSSPQVPCPPATWRNSSHSSLSVGSSLKVPSPPAPSSSSLLAAVDSSPEVPRPPAKLRKTSSSPLSVDSSPEVRCPSKMRKTSSSLLSVDSSLEVLRPPMPSSSSLLTVASSQKVLCPPKEKTESSSSWLSADSSPKVRRPPMPSSSSSLSVDPVDPSVKVPRPPMPSSCSSVSASQEDLIFHYFNPPPLPSQASLDTYDPDATINENPNENDSQEPQLDTPTLHWSIDPKFDEAVERALARCVAEPWCSNEFIYDAPRDFKSNLIAATNFIRNRFEGHCEFKIGITGDPHWRWYRRDCAYEGTFSKMYLLYAALKSKKDIEDSSGAMEVQLIKQFQEFPVVPFNGCLNIAAGGEGASNWSPHFCYVVVR